MKCNTRPLFSQPADPRIFAGRSGSSPRLRPLHGGCGVRIEIASHTLQMLPNKLSADPTPGAEHHGHSFTQGARRSGEAV